MIPELVSAQVTLFISQLAVTTLVIFFFFSGSVTRICDRGAFWVAGERKGGAEVFSWLSD